MTTENINLPHLIKNITFHFIKIHYKKYLEDNKLKIIPNNELENVINNLYDDKQKELKQYVRGTLRQNFKDYNTNFTLKTTTEEILLEMFEDTDYAKSRLVLEIQNYQDKL